MSYQIDSYGNAYFPAGVSVASIPATTGTQARVLVPGVNGRISSATVAQLITQSGGNLVTSVYGRTGAVTAALGDYNTDQVTEGQALYFSTSRARKSIFLTTFNTSGPATYDSNTGILNIPQYGSASNGNFVPLTRKISINGQTADLSVDRMFSVEEMVYPPIGIPLSNGTSWGASITNNSANWNTAFGWGNHALAGYLTSFTETDPTVPSHVKAITTTNISNWNTAYTWGNHALAGYLTSFTETDPIWTSEKANYALKTYVDTSISNLVDAAPTTLNTLNELAAALGDDANFSTSITTLIGTKEPAITAGTTAQYWRGDKTWQTLPIYTLSGLGGVPTSRSLTINGTSYDLSADRSWTINSMVYPSAGIAVSTGSAWGTSITDNSANWNSAFTDRFKWDGGAAGLVAATGRTSLGLGTAATANTGDFAAASHTHSIANITGLQTALDGKEPTIAAGTTAQYWRGDKTWQTLPTYDLSPYVPYTGATANVDLGLYGLTSRGLTISKYGSSVNGLIFEQAAGLGLGGAGYTTIGPVGTDGFGFYFSGATKAFYFSATAITTQRFYSLPDASGTIALTSNIPTLSGLGGVPTTRSLTINGVSYDLSADRSWTISTGISGSGTTNYLSKWTGSTSVGNSVAFDNGSAIGINTASPFESSAFKLDVNGGVIIKNTSGVPAQLILIDSNPATGGNNGFVQLVAGGNTATAFGQWQTYYGTSIASGTLRIQPAGGVVLVGSTTAITGAGLLQVAGDVNITGTFRVNGVAISSGTTLNGTGFVKVSGTTVSYDNNTYLTSLPSHNHDGRYIRLDTVNEQDGIVAHFRPTTSGGYTMMKFESKVNQTSDYGWILMQDDSANTNGAPTTEDIRMTIGVFNDFQGPGVHSDELWFQGGARLVQNVGSWDSEYNTIIGTPAAKTNGTTYEWRINNSSVMAISFGGILSVGGNTVYHAGNLTNLNQLTNGPGYLTSITSTQVTNALGYIPYNSTNPSGYITGYTETDTLSSVTGRGASTSTAITINGIDSALKVQHDGTSTAWRGRIGSFNASADKSSFLGNYTGRPGVFGHNNSLSAWAELYVNTLGVYGQGTLYLSWFTYVKANGGDTDYAIWHAGNLTNLNQLSNGPGYITSSATSLTLTGNLTVSSGNSTGGGIILADDGDIVDLNDAYCSMRFSAGVRIFSANRGGTPVITLSNTGAISGSSIAAGNITTGVNGSHIVQRDANGYIYANHVNFNTSETENPAINSFITSNGDGWSRKSTLAHVKNSIRSVADGTWSINITGSATDSSTDFLHSNRDFPNGTLVQTSIVYGEYGDPFVLEIRGNSYFNQMLIDIQIQGYIYGGTIIATAGLSNGKPISVRAIRVGGNLAFWWPNGGYWEGFNIKVYTAYAGRVVNKVTSITNSSQPTTDKQVDFSLVQSLHSSNYNSYSPTLTGGNASGTWGINVTGSAGSAGTLSNNATISGLNFGGVFALTASGASTGNSTGARLSESYGPVWNLSNSATWHHQVINGSSLCGFNAGGGNFGNGNYYGTGDVTAYYSDERLKTKINTITDAIEKIKSLEGFVYVENDLARSLGYTNQKEQAGVSAQQIQAVLPQAVSLAPFDMQGVAETGEVVSKSGENYLTVKYDRIVPLLIEGIKEQQLQIEELKKEIKELKNK